MNYLYVIAFLLSKSYAEGFDHIIVDGVHDNMFGAPLQSSDDSNGKKTIRQQTELTQYQVLSMFYFSTNGPSWGVGKEGWLDGDDPCTSSWLVIPHSTQIQFLFV